MLFLLLIVIVGVLFFLAATSRSKPTASSLSLLKSTSETFSITPNREFRTTRAYPEDMPLAVTITGTYAFWFNYNYDTHNYEADACYCRPSDPCPGRFTDRYRGVVFDGEPAPNPFTEDQFRHRFSFRYTATGHPLSLFVRLPRVTGHASCHYTSGTLAVVIRPLSLAEDAAIRGREETARRAEEQRREEERIRQEEEQQTREEAARKKQEDEEKQRSQRIEQEMQTRIRQLVTRYQAFPFYEDPDFLREYVKANVQLLRQQHDAIVAQYCEFHADEAFITRLKCEAAETYQRATFEMRALAAAEQLAVEQGSVPPLSQLPRKRLTAEEIRALKIRRFEVLAADNIAITQAKVESIQRARKELDQYDLDPDERDQLERDLIEKILDQEGINGTSTKETL